MVNNEIGNAIKQICQEKNLPLSAVISAIESSLAAAYRKEFGEENQNIKVIFNADNAKTTVFDVKTVVDDVNLEEQEKIWEDIKKRKEDGEDVNTEDVYRFNPRTEIMLSDAKKENKDYKTGDIIEKKLKVPKDYGRISAQTAKQVIIQRLREAERDNIFNKYKDKEGQLVLGTIQRKEGRKIFIDLENATGLLLPDGQIRKEGYNIGARLNFYINEVKVGNKGPEIILSRTHPDIIKELFTTEVPEIAADTVEIKAIAREAGDRSKIAVYTTEENIDPVGSCVGQRGSRVQSVINEAGGEKIDIIEWDEDPKIFIMNSLSPANIDSIELDNKNKIANIKVNDDQLSLAIGKYGQNVRLAAKLTEWKIDIISNETGKKIQEEDKKEEDKKEDKKEEDKKENKKEEDKKEEDKKEEDKKENKKEEIGRASCRERV